MPSVKELQVIPVKDSDGKELSHDETLARWLMTGKATRILPRQAVTEDDFPARFSDQDYDPAATGWADDYPLADELWDELSDNAKRTQHLLQVIDLSSDEDRLLLWRHDVMGMTFAELAKVYGVSRQAVHKRHTAIVARLRELGEPYLRG